MLHIMNYCNISIIPQQCYQYINNVISIAIKVKKTQCYLTSNDESLQCTVLNNQSLYYVPKSILNYAMLWLSEI